MSSWHLGHVYVNPSGPGTMDGEQLAHKPVPQYGQKTMREFFCLQVGQCVSFCVGTTETWLSI